MAELIIWVGWFVSVAVMMFTIAVLLTMRAKNARSYQGLSVWVLLMMGTAVAGFVLIFSQMISGIVASTSAVLVIEAFLDTIKMFSLGRSLSLLPEAVSFLGPFANLYICYDAVLFLVASASTLGAIFSLAGSLFYGLRIRFHSSNNDTFIFSELNEQTYTLAVSLMRTYSERCFLVFCSQEDSDKDYQDKVREAAHETQCHGALFVFTKASIASVWASVSGSNSRRVFVFGSKDELANMNGGMDLLDHIEETTTATNWPSVPADVYMFSSSDVDALALDVKMDTLNVSSALGGSPEGLPAVRAMRIDPTRLTVNNLIDTVPVFLAGEDIRNKDQSGVDHFVGNMRKVLIVGDTDFTREYLKGVLWSSKLGGEIGVAVSFVAANAEANAKRQLQLEMPGVFDHLIETGGDFGCTDSGYALKFVSCDPTKGDYSDYLLSDVCKGISLVVVDMGDDRVSAQVAMRTRELCEQRRLRTVVPEWDGTRGVPYISARICAVIHDVRLAKSVETLATNKRPTTRYAIHPICTDEMIYDCNNLFEGSMISLGANVNRLYCTNGDVESLTTDFDSNDVAFWSSEYNRNSSISSALHLKYGLYVFCRKCLSGEIGEVEGVRLPSDNVIRRIDWTMPIGKSDEYYEAALTAYEQYMNAEPIIVALDNPSDFSSPHTWRVRMEHDRWNAQTYTQGNVLADDSTISYYYEGVENASKPRTYIPIAKTHSCLVEFDELSGVNELTCKAAGELETYDRIIVNNMYPILHKGKTAR